jgi:hypothetical protein
MQFEAGLIGIGFVVVWMALPLLWYSMLEAAGIHFGRPTIPSIVIGFIVLLQYIGIPFLFFKLDSHRVDVVQDSAVMLRVWGATSAAITLLSFGFLLGRECVGPLSTFRGTCMRPLKRHQQVGVCVMGVVCVLVLLRYLTIVGFSNIAILAAIGLNEGVDQSVARSLMGNDFSGSYHWYQLFMRDILMIVVLVQYVQYKSSRRPSALIPLAVFGSALIFSLLMAVEKGPIANFIIAVMLVKVWLERDGRLWGGQLMAYSIAMMAILSATYMIFMGASDIRDAVGSVFSRIFTGQVEASYHYLRFFPNEEGWLLGRSLPNPGGILPFEPYPLTRSVKEFVSPELTKLGIVGSMPTVFWGELYANAGYLAVIIVTPVIGFALYLFNRILFQFRLDPTSLVLFVWSMLHYAQLSGTGLGTFIADSNLVAVLIVLIAIRTRIV